jgi:hypothetical protein
LDYFVGPGRNKRRGPQNSLNAMVLPGHTVQLSGHVTADQPTGVNVTFTGAASGSTTTDSSGNYNYSTSTAVLGVVYAVGVDQQQQTSNTAQASIAVTAPSLALTISYGTQRTVTLSGQATGIDAGSLTISFSGVVSGTASTNSSGVFQFTTQASSLGNIQASTTDSWGQASNTPQVTVSSNAPQIVDFTATLQVGNVWLFQGEVTDESPQGLVVTFGNLPSLVGVTTTVGANGWFSISITLQNGEQGVATAQTTDWWGLNSNVAQALV